MGPASKKITNKIKILIFENIETNQSSNLQGIYSTFFNYSYKMSRRGGDDSRDGVNRPDNHRRKWDKDEFEKKAKERDDEEKEKRRDHAKGMQDAATIRATAKASGKYESDDDDWDALDEDWEGIHKKSSIPRSKGDEPPVKRKTLSQRDYKVDLDSKLVKVRSLPRTHLRRNPEGTIATFVTVLSKIPSI